MGSMVLLPPSKLYILGNPHARINRTDARLRIVCRGMLAPRKFMQRRKKVEVFKDAADEVESKSWRRLMSDIEESGSAVPILGSHRAKGHALPRDLVLGTLVRFKQLKRWKFVSEILEWLRCQHWWDFSEMDFLMLITAHGKLGDFNKAERVLKYMNEKGYLPSVISYTALMEAYGRSGMYNKAEAIFHRMQSSGPTPSALTYQIILKTFVQGEKYEEAEAIFQSLMNEERSPFKPDQKMFHMMIYMYKKARNYDQARRIFAQMAEKGVPQSTVTYNSLMSFENNYKEVSRIYDQMQSSTSPPYWDTDDDDDYGGPKPSALYGKFTWKIEKFSQINKRELRSNAFEVGGYKWYILIYPQGCDVCNHLSLFLCAANHDKHLPGWSHFAQFTIAVVNNDPKKSKYSDTLHRFWKKEHDWGWKKFIELPKVLDGFINDDSLVIKAQVQVIREKANRPFRCLDCQYRRELVRVYLSNVEQICRRFIEDRKGKFSKLIEDKLRWSSLRAFWLGTDQITRRRMSRDKTDTILRAVVKNFFVEKEVTSTLVMDSLYSGLKALECHSKNKKGKIKLVEVEELPPPIVHIDGDMFVLTDDILLSLESVALGPVPLQPLTPKDEKGSQNRTKDGSSGEEFNKDSIERDERRLTEFGQRTLEFFVLAHIFSRIEVAHQEAVALKRQEELIREEEAAEQAENELKAKRSAADKEKRTKKKQAKQKRNCRKVKDRAKDEKSDMMMQDRHREQSLSDENMSEEIYSKQELITPGNASDTSDTVDDVAVTIQPDLEDRDCNPANWDTYELESHPNMESRKCVIQNGQTENTTTSIVDDSSSTCSTDSIPSVGMNESYKGNALQNSRSQPLSDRAKNQWGKDMQNRPSDTSHLVSATFRTPKPESEGVDKRRSLQQYLGEKEEVSLRQKELNGKDQVHVMQPSHSRTSGATLARASQSVKPPCVPLQQPRESPDNAAPSTTRTSSITVEAGNMKESHSSKPFTSSVHVRQATRSPQVSSKSEEEKHAIPPRSTTAQQASSMSRPSSAPLIPAQTPSVSLVSTVHTPPMLSRSLSDAGRLGTDPYTAAPSFVPQSYRSAIIGKNDIAAIPSGFSHLALTSSSQSFMSSIVAPSPQMSPTKDHAMVRPGLSFGSMKPDPFPSQYQPRDDCPRPEPSSIPSNISAGIDSINLYGSNLVAGIKRVDIHSELQARSVASGMPYPPQGMVADEFPHLDIINELLDEDRNVAMSATSLDYDHLRQHHSSSSSSSNRHHHLFNRHYSFPGNADIGSFSSLAHVDRAEFYYNDGGFPGAYGSSGGSPIRGFRERQLDLGAYGNGQIQGVIQNQWPYGAADLSMLSSGNAADAGGYCYQLPDNMNGMNAYMYPRPGNGL